MCRKIPARSSCQLRRRWILPGDMVPPEDCEVALDSSHRQPPVSRRQQLPERSWAGESREESRTGQVLTRKQTGPTRRSHKLTLALGVARCQTMMSPGWLLTRQLREGHK